MLDSKLLQTLASVIETNGFERAAIQLGVTQSAVSQRIKQLEVIVGQPLLIRSQPLEPTAAGKTLLQHYKQIKLLELDLMQHLKPETNDSTLNMLSIAADADSLSSWLMPALLPLIKQHGLLLRILPGEHPAEPATTQNSAHLCGWLSHDSTTTHGSQCRPLGMVRYECVCTTAYRQTYFPDGMTPSALACAPAVVLHGQATRHADYLGQVVAYQGNFPFSSMPTPDAMLDLIQAGLSYGLVPEELLGNMVEQGGLVILGTPLRLPLYWHHWRIEPGVARALGEALLAARQAGHAGLNNTQAGFITIND